MSKALMSNRPPIAKVRKTLKGLTPDGTAYTDGVIEALEWAINGGSTDGLEGVLAGDVPVVAPVAAVSNPVAVVAEPRLAPAVRIGTHPLATRIPTGDFAGEYINRKINGLDDVDVMKALMDGHDSVLIEGPTGSAKTSLVFAFATKEKLPVVTVACNGGIDVRALLGGWVPTGDGKFRYEAGDLATVVEHGGILYLDEVNFMPPKIAAVLYGLLDKRRTLYISEAAGSDSPTVIKAHDRLFIVATMNPTGGAYAGTRPMNAAFANRFSAHLTWDYDARVEGKLIKSDSLRELGSKLRERVDAGDLTTPVPTNAALGFDFAVGNFVNRFASDEAPVVSEVIEVYSVRIKTELGLIAPAPADSEFERLLDEHVALNG